MRPKNTFSHSKANSNLKSNKGQWLWWVMVLTVVVLLKHHYSIASAHELEWVLRPLAMLLEWLTGHDFQQVINGEWLSSSANVRLVKSCAGINFMIMSFMTYAWVFRPEKGSFTNHSLISCFLHASGQFLLLTSAIIAAWATCLLANSLRIIVAITLETQNWALDFIDINAEQLHRLIGMAVYVPLLSLQMMLDNHTYKHNKNLVLIAPIILYLLLMILVPLLTGNALQNPAKFIEHSLYVLSMAALVGVIVWLKQFVRRQRRHIPEDKYY